MAARACSDSVELMTLAVSLGGIGDPHPTPGEHDPRRHVRKHRLAAGITDGLVRVSIGCEDVDDLIADFEQAFAAVEVPEPAAAR